MGCYQIVISGDIVKTLENRIPIFKCFDYMTVPEGPRPGGPPWGDWPQAGLRGLLRQGIRPIRKSQGKSGLLREGLAWQAKPAA